MHTYTYPHIPALGALAATTGFFDGVHSGHRAVLRELLHVAKSSGLPSCVVTYHPHPRVVLGKDEGLFFLNTFEEKQQLLASLGVEHLVVIPFTKELAELNAESFFVQYLLKTLNVQQLVVGYDHNMGKNAAAGFEAIKTLGKAHGVEITQVQAYTQNAVEVSSTKARNALDEGNILAANAMLGYEYSLSGTVINGNRVGSKIGFPTANIAPDCTQKMLPKNGAYAVRVTLGGGHYGGMLNVGTRPTVSNGGSRSVEVHIFDFSQNIYEREITVSFVERLREEKRMSSLEELSRQLRKDEERARELLMRTKTPSNP